MFIAGNDRTPNMIYKKNNKNGWPAGRPLPSFCKSKLKITQKNNLKNIRKRLLLSRKGKTIVKTVSKKQVLNVYKLFPKNDHNF